MYSIFIVARVQIYREGVAALFASSNRFVVCGSSTCVSASVNIDSQAVLIDYPSISPSILSQYTLSRREELPIVVFGTPDDMDVILTLLEAGAVACVGQDSSALELHDAVLAAVEKHAILPATHAAALLARLRTRSRMGSVKTSPALTARELQVAELMGRHRSNKEIARTLGISVHTVKIHAHHVIQKLAIDRRSQTQESLRAAGYGG